MPSNPLPPQKKNKVQHGRISSRCNSLTSYTAPFRPSVQSRVTAEKTDRFKIHLNSKENLSDFSETKIFKIVNTWSKWYSTPRTKSKSNYMSP